MHKNKKDFLTDLADFPFYFSKAFAFYSGINSQEYCLVYMKQVRCQLFLKNFN